MKNSSAAKAGPVDRATAWGCCVTNLLVFPGLGSLAAKRWSGAPQMVLSGVGVLLTSFWPVWFVRAVMTTHEMPQGFGPHIGKALWGIGLFGVGWVWSAWTSWSILRESRKEHE